MKQISNSKPGEKLWDTASQKGTSNPDRGWIYQKWSHEQLIQAQKAPLPMTRMLKTFGDPGRAPPG